jgi:hypothetical protein
MRWYKEKDSSKKTLVTGLKELQDLREERRLK